MVQFQEAPVVQPEFHVPDEQYYTILLQNRMGLSSFVLAMTD